MLGLVNYAREGPRRARRIKKDPIKLTALLYLKEALLNEHYEECQYYVEMAQTYGAQVFEITDLLEDPRRDPE